MSSTKWGCFGRGFFSSTRDDADLSCGCVDRGYKAAGVVPARLHHRGGARGQPGPAALNSGISHDGQKAVSHQSKLHPDLAQKRAAHFAVANHSAIALLFLESLVGSLLLRAWSFVKPPFGTCWRDCWRLPRPYRPARKMVAHSEKILISGCLRFFRLKLIAGLKSKRLFQFGPAARGRRVDQNELGN